ncbi:hypothetical protein L7F22_041763 [Adiantum nelumboides]|nr:hypothetical protein [Adiantum nelumboides]
MNVKRPESSTNSSPMSHVSSPKERKSLLSSCYGHSHSPSAMSGDASEGSFTGEDFTPSRLSNNLVVRSPILYSPYTHSPYFFSPLSNTSLHSLNVTSPRSSIQSDASHASVETCIESHVQDSFDSSKFAMLKPHETNGTSAHSPHSIASFPDANDGGRSGGSSLSFTSPEMEILDEGLTSNLNSTKSTMDNRGAKSTMADFISRGGPTMNRSFSTSQVTFTGDQRPKPMLKKYYSAQFSGEGQAKGANPMQDTTYSVLDELFPLKRPNRFKQGADVAHNQHASESGMAESAMMGDNKKMVQCKISSMSPLERPAQEVNVMQGGDEDGFTYSPVASAFVFSPRRTSQNSYFMRSKLSASKPQYKESNLASSNHENGMQQ